MMLLLLLVLFPTFLYNAEQDAEAQMEQVKINSEEEKKLFADSIKRFDHDLIEKLVKRNPKLVNIPIDYGIYGTPLCNALFHDNYRKARFFLQHGADPEFLNLPEEPLKSFRVGWRSLFGFMSPRDQQKILLEESYCQAKKETPIDIVKGKIKKIEKDMADLNAQIKDKRNAAIKQKLEYNQGGNQYMLDNTKHLLAEMERAKYSAATRGWQSLQKKLAPALKKQSVLKKQTGINRRYCFSKNS